MSDVAQISNLTKKFGDNTALDSITVALPKGKIVGLAGPDGAGKTTFIRLLLGLLVPTGGKISVLEKSAARIFDFTVFALYIESKPSAVHIIVVEFNFVV